MPHGKPIDERSLLGMLRSERDAADSFVNGSPMGAQRAEGMRYYLGGKLGNEVKDRSQVVSRDLFETVEWMMPQLMEAFSGDIVRFNPEGEEDVAQAEQATDFMQYVLMRQNNGFMILYDWFKDTLISKTGFVKYFWDSNTRPRVDQYSAVDQEELATLLDSPEAELVGEPEEVSPGKFDVTIAVTPRDGQLKLEVTPPENLLVRAGTVTLGDAGYVSELFEATESDLKEMGFPEDKIADVKFTGEPTIISRQNNSLRWARHSGDGTQEAGGDNTGHSHASMRVADITEAYIRIDANADGFTELLQVIHTDNVILSIEEVEEIPYIELNAIRIPHKLFGLSIHDIMKDIVEVKSALMRGVLDHTYSTVNGRWEAVETAVNLKDLLNPAPGGVVRVTAPGMVNALQTPALDPASFGLLEYMDRVKEDRAGVNKVQQGLDKTVLGSNVAVGALDKAMSAAEMRIGMIARIFAESGVRELFYRAYGCIVRNQSKETIIRLRDEFVPIRPFDWIDRMDMQVMVGLGNTSPAVLMQELTVIRDTMSLIGGAAPGIIEPKNLYNFAVEMAKALGRKDYDKFFTEPPANPPPPPPSPQELIETKKLEQEDRKITLSEAEHELDIAKFKWEKIINAAEIELEDRQERPVGIQTGK